MYNFDLFVFFIVKIYKYKTYINIKHIYKYVTH